VLVLHTPPTEETDRGLSGLDVDCAVVGLDPRWPLRLPDGWRLCQCLHYDLKGWYWVLERAGEVVCLDIIDDPQGLGRDGFPTARFATGQEPIAPPEVQAAYLTAKRVRKGLLGGDEWSRIGKLASADPERYQAALEAVVGPRIAGLLAGPALEGRPPDPATRGQARRLQWLRRYRTPARALSGLAIGARRELERVRRPTGLLVLVVGPDGSGKSALADALPEVLGGMFRRQTRVHWRPGLLPRPGAVVGREAADPTRPHARPAHGRATSLALLGYYWADFLVGGWLQMMPFRARTGLVVMERGWWDMAVDQRRYRLQVPGRLVRALGALLPAPDLTLVLESPPAVLRGRKAELPEAELRRQATAWRHALPDRLHRLRLDVSRPLEAVVGEAREEVVRLLEERAVARLGAGWAGLPSRPSPRWLVPRGPRRAAAAALAIYQPMTLRARTGWQAARLLGSLGGLRLLPRGAAPPREVREALAPHLPPGGTLAVGRVIHPDRGRCVALLLDRDGGVRALAKVGTDPAAAADLRREADAMQSFGGLLPPPVSAPRVLAAEGGVLLLEAVAWRLRRRPWLLDAEVAHALGVFARAAGRGDATARAGHGDFAPWNLLRTTDGWVLIDWEDASAAHSRFFDLCHYVVQGHVLLGRPSMEAIVDGFRGGGGWVGQAVGAYADGAGLPVGEAEQALKSYLGTIKTRLRPIGVGERDGSPRRRRLLEQLEQ
jgi:thymidylate kinase